MAIEWRKTYIETTEAFGRKWSNERIGSRMEFDFIIINFWIKISYSLYQCKIIKKQFIKCNILILYKIKLCNNNENLICSNK